MPEKSAAAKAASDAAYEKAVIDFGKAVQVMQKGDFSGAQGAFETIATSDLDEPVLRERARSYGQMCARRTASPTAPPRNSEERYLHAVVQLNRGQIDEALTLLEQALRENPASAKLFYARASAHAVKGRAEAAVEDLRQAIAIEPQTRFQAVNDPDFEKIREEPSFIDIIEPTPAGA